MTDYKRRLQKLVPTWYAILGEKSMNDFDNTNRGAIWPNDRKSQDTHPDYTGSINIEGTEYFLDAWKKPEGAADRAPVLKFSVKRKDKQS